MSGGKAPGKVLGIGRAWLLAFLAAAALQAGPARGEGDVTADRVAGLPSDWITCLAADQDGVWAGTGNAGLALVSPSGKVARTVRASRGLPSDAVKSIAAFRGKLYVGTDAGLAVADGGSWEILKQVEQTDLKNVHLRADPGGKALWAGAVNLAGGLLRFDGSRWEFMGGKNRGLLNNVQAFAFRDDAVWLGTSTSGVCRLAGEAFGQFRTADGLPSANVLALETFGGAVWAGTSAGAARYEDGRWTPFAGAAGFPLKAVFCAAASPTVIYFGGRGGLVRYRAGRFEPFAPEGIQLGDVNALLWAEGTLYAGTSRGLFLVKGW